MSECSRSTQAPSRPWYAWIPHVLAAVLATGLAISGMTRQAIVDTRGSRAESASGDLEAGDGHFSADTPNQRWNRTEVHVVLDDSLRALPIPAPELVRAAFATWNDTGVALPQLVFTWGQGAKPSLKPDGKSTVLLAPIDFEGHETDLAITIGFSNPSNGEISEADIVINAKHIFANVSLEQAEQSGKQAHSERGAMGQNSCSGSLDADACNDSYDLENVLTHEAGHFFGLSENYDDPKATMFSCTSACEIHKRDLNHADVLQISELYEDAASESPKCSGVQIGGDPQKLHLSWWFGISCVVALFFMRHHQLLPQPTKNNRRA